MHQEENKFHSRQDTFFVGYNVTAYLQQQLPCLACVSFQRHDLSATVQLQLQTEKLQIGIQNSAIHERKTSLKSVRHSEQKSQRFIMIKDTAVDKE
jgi:hypothetical protein